jgi:putative DNA primase/helicase
VSIENFIEAIRQSTGGAPLLSEIVPGKMVRFATNDRKRDQAGWCKLFEDGEGGVYGCWRQGISESWQAGTFRTPEEKAAFRAKVQKAREDAARMLEENRRICREKSARLWELGHEVDPKHPYLLKKGVKSHGIKQLGQSLLVPFCDTVGALHGLQFIKPDGIKRQKKDTAVSGHYHAMGEPDGIFLIVEGYATSATLHEITGHAVACAFNAGNLRYVAEALRKKYPDTTLVICADDDHLKKGNPGLRQAIEAARAVNGLVAVPKFSPKRGETDKDFNDLARLEGPEAVKACIEAATTPAPEDPSPSDPSLNEVIRRLSRLSPLQYDQVRRKEAKELGVRPSTLDAVIREARKGSVPEDLPFAEVEPWPEPIDPGQLLTEISNTVRRFIVCDREISHAVALWVAMTWFIDVVQVAPLAVITSPEKRCGKSQLLFLLGRLSARAITTSSISPAALYRTIDAWCPTLLIDEADAFMKDNEELRGLLNCGHTRESAFVIRTVGDDFTPTKFNTWGAKALAGIGHLADTLMDRSIILELRRKLPHEEVDRIRHAETGLFDGLRSKLARFAEDYRERIRQARPPLPQSLNDRAQDNWEPLLAIAMAAGNDWRQFGTTAALKLSGGESAAQTIGTELLADIQEIFGDNRDRITTAELIRLLCKDEEKPWATFNRGNSITPRQVVKRLKEYGILSRTIRLGIETAKGYTLDQFRETFSRYLSPSPELSVTSSQTSNHADLAVTDHSTCFGNEMQFVTCKPAASAGCDNVTDKNPEEGAIVLSEADLLEVSL